MENKKIGFFSRVKIAIAKLENYSMFLEEKLSIAIKYFFLIVLIAVVAVALAQTYDMSQMLSKGYQYIQNELPDFSYENGNLNFSERILAYDSEYDIYMIADTEDVTEQTLKEYKSQIKTSGVIFLKNYAIYKNGDLEVKYNYHDLQMQYQIESLDKAKFLQEIDTIGIAGMTITIFLVLIVSIYIVQWVSILLDWLIMSVFALIASRICRVNLQWKHALNLSIYALTLSILLSALYNIAYCLTGFYTQYFRLVYLLISYVYIVAVILIIKSDILKQKVEIAKIEEVQKQVHEELSHPEEKKEEEKKENKKPKDEKEPEPEENTTNGEPDGSEI